MKSPARVAHHVVRMVKSVTISTWLIRSIGRQGMSDVSSISATALIVLKLSPVHHRQNQRTHKKKTKGYSVVVQV